ncbi:MAG: asparaginase [Gemmatimonadota bacterium]
MVNRVRVFRGEELESEHVVHAVVAGLPGGAMAVGDPGLVTYWRSAMKPFQVVPLVRDGGAAAADFGQAELALACASHGGTDRHVDLARGMLDRLGLDESALACGPHKPYDREAADALVREGRVPSRLHNNCSGKHSGILALCQQHGWDSAGYQEYDHPAQRRVRSSMAEWVDSDPESWFWAPDGCGVPTPKLALAEMARAFSRLMLSAKQDEAAGTVVEAMTDRPLLTSAQGRVPLTIMQATGGRLLAKEGAEGVLCVAATDDSWGLALKIMDGSLRGTGPAAVEFLCALDLLRPDETERLSGLRAPPLINTRGEAVGRLEAVLRPVPVGSG